jgi:uncharacterized membrane protein
MSQAVVSEDVAPSINPWHLLGYGGLLALMVFVIWLDNIFILNFLHVMSGVLWTGIDLFMGFFVGPALRSTPFEARRAVTMRLVPRTLFLMPTLAIITGTTGWFHARQLGFLDTPWPQYGWVLAALVIITILTVQGLGVLLPTNVRVYLELRKPLPDRERIGRLLKSYVYLVGFQGLMQVAMIVVMAKFVTGL